MRGIFSEEEYTTSERLTHVLLCIMGGNITYGKRISIVLGIKPPTVNDYIRELENIGLIKKGKRAQEQNYEIDWDKFLNVFKELVEKDYYEFEDLVAQAFFKPSFKIKLPAKFINNLPKSVIIEYYKILGQLINDLIKTKEDIPIEKIHQPFFTSIYFVSRETEKEVKKLFPKFWNDIKMFSWFMSNKYRAISHKAMISLITGGWE